MTSHLFAKSVSAVFKAGRTTLGLALVLAACASPLYASGPLPGVPEIDPGSLASALSLLTGGALLLADRCRRK